MYVVEHDEILDGMRIVATFSAMGHRCGYVGVDKTHPFYGLKHTDPVPEKFTARKKEAMAGKVGKRGVIDLFCAALSDDATVGFLFDVHGSITYSGGNNYPTHNEDGKWWFFGFDCAHHKDGKDCASAEKYGFKMYPEYDFYGGEARTLDYVLQEGYSLAAQLSEIKE